MKPVASLRTLQPFEFDPGSGEFRPSDAARELIAERGPYDVESVRRRLPKLA